MLLNFLLLSVSEPLVAYEKIWILGDNFASNSVGQHYSSRKNGGKMYMKHKFDSSIYIDNDIKSAGTNAFSRLCNQLMRAINEQSVFPKIIVIVPDDDLAKYFKPEDKEVSKNLGRALNWVAVEFDRVIAAHKEKLPAKVLKEKYPTIIGIEAPLHDNFVNNVIRMKFNKALEMVCQFHNDVYPLRLKKIWDGQDNSLFSHDEVRYTFNGLRAYWEAVDKTVKFADTILLQKSARTTKKFGCQQHPQNQLPGQLQRKPDDRFHWKKNY